MNYVLLFFFVFYIQKFPELQTKHYGSLQSIREQLPNENQIYKAETSTDEELRNKLFHHILMELTTAAKMTVAEAESTFKYFGKGYYPKVSVLKDIYESDRTDEEKEKLINFEVHRAVKNVVEAITNDHLGVLGDQPQSMKDLVGECFPLYYSC